MHRRLHPELPIFEVADGARRVLYAPGHLASSALALEPWAREAERRWDDFARQPFAPEALVVYLSNSCNLACGYCWAARRSGRTVAPSRHQTVSIEAVRAAAELVARNAAAARRPFLLAAHGGGEPTVEWRLLGRIVESTREIASAAGIPWSGYVATNGVLTDERMRTLVEWFDAVGISCDGPPEIQDGQRPRVGGRPSSAFVERMARTVTGSSRRLSIRATITRESMPRQAEIAAYLCDVLGAHEIRFEPAFGDRESPGEFRPEEAERFAGHFLEAQRVASDRGTSLTVSGVRPGEAHGPYCGVLKNSLQLIPGDLVAGCFILADDIAAARAPLLVLGSAAGGTLEIDQERAVEHRARATRIPDACRDCINIHHCARDCPESCILLDEVPSVGGFRCRLQKILAERWILDLSEGAGKARRPAARGSALRLVEERIASAPREVDAGAILLQAAALGDRLLEDRPALPKPVWARRAYDERGAFACARLAERVRRAPARPVSVYVHVPFCGSRCAFCDCYAVPLGHNSRARQEAYVQQLGAEIETWSSWGALAHRPVTTVHFGGGTPNFLDDDLLEGLLGVCRDRLSVSAGTEWALESTSSLLSAADIEQLRSWGFRRLHVGVQTLEPEVRRRIGRHETAEEVVAKLEAALARGLVTSVDIIYGLPGQTLAGLIRTLGRLARLGVHGFSLYQLQRSPRNERFLASQQDLPDRLDAWLMFQAAEQLLRRLGFRKTHFTHFARPEDRNLYYGYGLRGEDLVALGASADGVIDGYHYRHAMLGGYASGVGGGTLGLEGGVEETPEERAARPVQDALTSGEIDERDCPAALVDEWLALALVARSGEGRLTLTSNGSWLVTPMLAQLEAHGAADRTGEGGHNSP